MDKRTGWTLNHHGPLIVLGANPTELLASVAGQRGPESAPPYPIAERNRGNAAGDSCLVRKNYLIAGAFPST
jgi:hypothetical protein